MRERATPLLAALLWAGAPSLAFAQRLGGAAAFEPPLLRLVLGLVLCTLVAIVAALAIRRFLRPGGPNGASGRVSLLRSPSARLRVIESHRISPHADVCMFVCDNREYLVVVSPSATSVLRDEAISEELKA
jgi:hypothetical protein